VIPQGLVSFHLSPEGKAASLEVAEVEEFERVPEESGAR
jgi:hypothetical protein